MQTLWDDKEAKHYQDELALRVYTSRLLGRDPSLVLHGGGNTSVKIEETNIFGNRETVLYVKGSGWDLQTIEKEGFAPVELDYVKRLAELDELSDPQMVNELKTHMKNASAPAPSVETILHAILPYKYVDHTHADAVLTLTNSKNGSKKIREIYGDSVVIVPYIMPGFVLAKLCQQMYEEQANKNTVGMILMNHGVFSFGATAKESYERMISLVDRAEAFIRQQHAWALPQYPPVKTQVDRRQLAALRKSIADVAGQPMICSVHNDARVMGFAMRADINKISQQGPLTPDHVIRTKRLPMLGRDVPGYASAYREYFARHADDRLVMLDAAPRIVIDREIGMITIGDNARSSDIVNDIYRHTMDVIERAEQLGGFQALAEKDIFEVEYWDLEQAKLRKSSAKPVFEGEIVLVTGAASGIGKACVDSFLQRGAAVAGLDVNPAIAELHKGNPAYRGYVCDVSDAGQINSCLDRCVQDFGGLDMLVLNAGIFPGGCEIAEMQSSTWEKVMKINLDANMVLMREAYPLLKQACRGGRVVVIGSKNVPAPGPGAAAYSASKAALNQLARVAALEWGRDHIRINTLHPDAVFDTGIWTEEVLQARAKHYGMTVEQYKTKNVLKVEITSHDVAELTAELCGPLFAKTTAAQIPVDGGNDRVI